MLTVFYGDVLFLCEIPPNACVVPYSMISVPKVKLIGNSMKQHVFKINKNFLSRFNNVNNYTVAWTGTNDFPHGQRNGKFAIRQRSLRSH